MHAAAPRPTSALAVASLVMGILGWSLLPFIGSIVAVVTGHMGRREIRQSPVPMEGDGLALAGLILGWLAITLGLLCVVAFLAFIAFFGGLAMMAHMF